MKRTIRQFRRGVHNSELGKTTKVYLNNVGGKLFEVAWFDLGEVYHYCSAEKQRQVTVLRYEVHTDRELTEDQMEERANLELDLMQYDTGPDLWSYEPEKGCPFVDVEFDEEATDNGVSEYLNCSHRIA